MDIAGYIAELIYKHDCVIIPDFGGIIANPAKGGINSVTEQVVPASKSLAFNQELRNNDGLLANHLASKAGMGYADALATIKEYVRNIWSKLDDNVNYDIKEVGTFYVNKDGRLQFIPSRRANYLLDSFGLYPVKAKKVTIEEEDEVFEVQEPLMVTSRKTTDRPTIVYEASDEEEHELTITHKSTGGVNWLVAALAVITIGFSVLVAGNTVLKDTQLGNMLDLGITTTHKQTTTLKEEQTEETVAEVKYQYYVIGGAFKDGDNAEKFAQKLQNEGYTGEYAGATINGMTRVSYAMFSSEEEANTFLNKIKTKNEFAWVHKQEK